MRLTDSEMLEAEEVRALALVAIGDHGRAESPGVFVANVRGLKLRVDLNDADADRLEVSADGRRVAVMHWAHRVWVEAFEPGPWEARLDRPPVGRWQSFKLGWREARRE